MAAGANPFIFATPLERPEQLVGRDKELAELLRLARSGTYALLEAPRRYGKTSLLGAAASRWREDEGGLALRVDFSRVLTTEEAARRVRVAYEDETAHGRLAELLRELLASIRLRLGPLEIGPRRAGEVDHAAQLHELLEVPAQVARRTERRSLVAFDEFQDVLAVDGLDGLLRSHLQHHRPHATYVFAGSEPSLLSALFAERSRPLYGQAKPVRLARIDPTLLASNIAEQFEATGKIAGEGGVALAEVGAGHPQRTMLLAWHLWERTGSRETATRELASAASEDALRDRRPELDATLGAMSDNERRTAVAIAHGLAPSGTRAQRATAIRNRSTAGHAARALRDRGEAERSSDGLWALADPLLAAHLRREHPLENWAG